jgi:hypothetical protein
MSVDLILGDCHEFEIPPFDVVITDPPYPDYYTDEYQYRDGMIDFLNDYDCRQLVFWSAKVDFPLDYTAIHIWDKAIGISAYERIFERNGGEGYKLFREMSIFSSVRAQIGGDKFYNHPSQKPARLIRKLLLEFTKPGDTVADFFAGSGTTAVACVQTGRNFIGYEIDPKYHAIAMQRVHEAQMQPRLL